MRCRISFYVPIFAALAACIVCTLPAIAGTNAPEKAPSAAPKPRPDQTAKVYTNDDLGWSNPSSVATNVSQSGASVATPSTNETNAEGVAPNPQEDPQWYAQQVVALEAELAAVANKEDQLRQFRSNSLQLPTGLVISAPTEGVTTDDFIAQRAARRAEINQKLDDLADLARVNGLPPGVVNQALSPDEVTVATTATIDDVASQYQNISDQLTQIQAALADMQQQTAARGITLLPSNPANGGNLTTDLLDRLNAQASALQNNLSAVEDSARTLNIPPGDLR